MQHRRSGSDSSVLTQEYTEDMDSMLLACFGSERLDQATIKDPDAPSKKAGPPSPLAAQQTGRKTGRDSPARLPVRRKRLSGQSDSGGDVEESPTVPLTAAPVVPPSATAVVEDVDPSLSAEQFALTAAPSLATAEEPADVHATEEIHVPSPPDVTHTPPRRQSNPDAVTVPPVFTVEQTRELESAPSALPAPFAAVPEVVSDSAGSESSPSPQSSMGNLFGSQPRLLRQSASPDTVLTNGTSSQSLAALRNQPPQHSNAADRARVMLASAAAYQAKRRASEDVVAPQPIPKQQASRPPAQRQEEAVAPSVPSTSPSIHSDPLLDVEYTAMFNPTFGDDDRRSGAGVSAAGERGSSVASIQSTASSTPIVFQHQESNSSTAYPSRRRASQGLALAAAEAASPPHAPARPVTHEIGVQATPKRSSPKRQKSRPQPGHHHEEQYPVAEIPVSPVVVPVTRSGGEINPWSGETSPPLSVSGNHSTPVHGSLPVSVTPGSASTGFAAAAARCEALGLLQPAANSPRPHSINAISSPNERFGKDDLPPSSSKMGKLLRDEFSVVSAPSGEYQIVDRRPSSGVFESSTTSGVYLREQSRHTLGAPGVAAKTALDYGSAPPLTSPFRPAMMSPATAIDRRAESSFSLEKRYSRSLFGDSLSSSLVQAAAPSPTVRVHRYW